MDGDNSSTRKNIKTAKQPKQPKKLSERYLRNAGEYYLNRFPASSNHFMTVMTRKIDKSCHVHVDQDKQHWIDHVRDVVVPYFTELGFLNDALYSRGLYNSLKNKGLSAYVIRNRMKLKGVEDNIINELTTDSENGVNDKTAVHVFAKKKKIGRYRIAPSNDDYEKRRDLGKLARAGFSYELAMSVFD